MDTTFLKDSTKFQRTKTKAGHQFYTEDASLVWTKDKTYKGNAGMKSGIVKPLDEAYGNNVKHEIRNSEKYSRVFCSTPKCQFQIWFAMADKEEKELTNKSKFKFFRSIKRTHSVAAHLDEIKNP